MKTILTILGAGILGLIVGSIPGYLRGQSLGAQSGITVGVCWVGEAAIAARVMTPEQAAQMGTAIPTKASAKEIADFLAANPDFTDGCKQALNGMVQGAK